MQYYKDTLTNTRGDSLVGYRVRLRAFATPPGDIIPIYSDESGTPIKAVSGIDNTAVTDNTGFFGFWFDAGQYLIEILDSRGVTVRAPIPLVLDQGQGGVGSGKPRTVVFTSVGGVGERFPPTGDFSTVPDTEGNLGVSFDGSISIQTDAGRLVPGVDITEPDGVAAMTTLGDIGAGKTVSFTTYDTGVPSGSGDVDQLLATLKRFYVDRAPYNAKCDGVTDDRAALLACHIAADAAGGAVIYPNGKTVRLSGALNVPTTKGIAFIGTRDGAPCTIKATDNATNFNPIALLGTKRGGTSNINGCTITGLIIDANNRYGKGILTENARNVKIFGNRFVGFSQPGNATADPVFPLSAAIYHYCYPDVAVDPIGNDTYDNYIDARPLVGGVQADPTINEYNAGTLGASLGIGYEGGSDAGSPSPPDQFAMNGQAVPAAHRHRGGSVRRNKVLGAVYCLSISVVNGIDVQDNVFAFASRPISGQNGFNFCRILRNKLGPHFSTALLSNFVNNDNEIAYNETYSDRVVGNPVIQLAFGGSRNKIHHNTIYCPQSSFGGTASHHIYVGMMANDNEVYENYCYGAFAKGMIVAESATTTTGSQLNFGFNQPSSDYDLKVSGPSNGNKIINNRGYSTMGGKVRPFILLDQVSDARGQWGLTNTVVSGNVALNDDFSMVFQTLTDTAGLNTAIYVNNPFGPDTGPERVSIDPKMQFVKRSGNRGDPGLVKVEEGSWSSANGAFLSAAGTGDIDVYDATVTVGGTAYPGPNRLTRRGGKLVSIAPGGVATRTDSFTTANSVNITRGTGANGNVITRSGGTAGTYDAALTTTNSYTISQSPELATRHRIGNEYVLGLGASATIPGSPLANLRLGMSVAATGELILLVSNDGVPYLSSGIYVGEGEVWRWWPESGNPSDSSTPMNGAVVQVRTSTGQTATLRLKQADAANLQSGNFIPFFLIRRGLVDVLPVGVHTA